MEAATAADLTQASEIAIRYITLGSRVMVSKGYEVDLTVASFLHNPTKSCGLGDVVISFEWNDTANVQLFVEMM